MNRRLAIVIGTLVLVLISLGTLIFFATNSHIPNSKSDSSSKNVAAVIDLHIRNRDPRFSSVTILKFSENIDERHIAFIVGGLDDRDNIGVIDTSLPADQAVITGPATNFSVEDLNSMSKSIRDYIVDWQGGESKE